MSDEDEDQESQDEPKDIPALRDALKREKARRKELEPQAAAGAEAARELRLLKAGVDTTTYVGQVVAAAAAHDGIDDPEDIKTLLQVVKAEARGELTEAS